MSGGSKGGGGGGPARIKETSCDVYEETDVQSPDPAVLPLSKVRDVLLVELSTEGRARLRAVTRDHHVLGGLIPPSLARIVRCIQEQGETYEAEITKKDGARVRVLIRTAR